MGRVSEANISKILDLNLHHRLRMIHPKIHMWVIQPPARPSTVHNNQQDTVNWAFEDTNSAVGVR